jgi:hypothetical protein
MVWTARTGRLNAGFYEYKYAVDFDDGATRTVSDPSEQGCVDPYTPPPGF